MSMSISDLPSVGVFVFRFLIYLLKFGWSVLWMFSLRENYGDWRVSSG